MDYTRHTKYCILLGILISLFGVKKVLELISFKTGYPITVSLSIPFFWLGAIPHILLLTPDLDSPTSVVTQRLGHFNPYKPFVEWGHRHALHHWFWGPINLMSLYVIPLLFLKVEIPYSVLVGAVSMIWCHLLCDWYHDDVEESWVVKNAKKVL